MHTGPLARRNRTSFGPLAEAGAYRNETDPVGQQARRSPNVHSVNKLAGYLERRRPAAKRQFAATSGRRNDKSQQSGTRSALCEIL